MSQATVLAQGLPLPFYVTETSEQFLKEARRMDFKRWVLAGIVASMAMGMWEMVLEQFVGGNGFWAVPARWRHAVA